MDEKTPPRSTIASVRDYQQRTIALVYDFDGTLSPLNMQEYTVFPELGVDPSTFWRDVKREAVANEATEVLTYMRMMAKRICDGELPITRTRLKELGSKIEFFPGVEDWFDRVNDYVREATKGYVSVRHYVVTSGLREIVDGVSVRDKLARVFGSQYHWDSYGRPDFVDRVITDVSKTQYLFRINKGAEGLENSVNEHMPESARPIPFQNIIYYGDGETDVPSMAVTRKNGGYALAVHKDGFSQEIVKCDQLFKARRINFYAPADYRHNSRLWIYTRVILDRIMADIGLRAASYVFQKNAAIP